jgi:hypothetical protein
MLLAIFRNNNTFLLAGAWLCRFDTLWPGLKTLHKVKFSTWVPCMRRQDVAFRVHAFKGQ